MPPRARSRPAPRAGRGTRRPWRVRSRWSATRRPAAPWRGARWPSRRAPRGGAAHGLGGAGGSGRGGALNERRRPITRASGRAPQSSLCMPPPSGPNSRRRRVEELSGPPFTRERSHATRQGGAAGREARPALARPRNAASRRRVLSRAARAPPGHQRRAAVDQPGVELHQVRAGRDLGPGVRAAHHAADADDRKAAAERRAQLADHAVAGLRTPARPTGRRLSSACGRPRTASRASVVLVAMTPSMPWRCSVAAITRDLGLVEVGRDLHEQRHRPPVLARELVRDAPATAAEQGVERLVALQGAQVRGVRARDVDRHVVGVRVHAVEAGQIVVARRARSASPRSCRCSGRARRRRRESARAARWR